MSFGCSVFRKLSYLCHPIHFLWYNIWFFNTQPLNYHSWFPDIILCKYLLGRWFTIFLDWSQRSCAGFIKPARRRTTTFNQTENPACLPPLSHWCHTQGWKPAFISDIPPSPATFKNYLQMIDIMIWSTSFSTAKYRHFSGSKWLA